MVQTLFGEWVYAAPRKRGRPRFEWTEENSHKVSMLLAMGWSNERIAGCILDPRTGKSISTATLQRYFRCELAVRDRARDRFVAHQLMVTTQAALGGNVGAMRLLQQLIDRNDRQVAELSVARRKPEKPAPAQLGKKGIIAREAEDANAQLEAELLAEVERAGRKH